LGSLQRSQHTTVGGIGLERWLRKRALLLPEEVSDQVGEKCGLVRAILQTGSESGSTAAVSFDTSRERFTTSDEKCHINFVACDSRWESRFAQALERMPEVLAYVKNFCLGFKIPYTFQGSAANYVPDYIVRLDDGHGPDDPLNAVVEVSGRELEQKEAKVDTTAKLWVPAVNADGRFGRWAFLEITDPYSAQGAIRNLLASAGANGGRARRPAARGV
jgi:type III restriction enzyme